MIRSIVFIDPPAFYTTVEGLVAPALRGRPVAVAPAGADRATLLAVSPEARAAGLTRDTPVHRARKVCPDVILLPPNPALYARASHALTHILRFYAPTIEPRGYGHAFLDLTGTGRLFGPVVDVAERIRREVQHRLGLPDAPIVDLGPYAERAFDERAEARAAGARFFDNMLANATVNVVTGSSLYLPFTHMGKYRFSKIK